MLVQTLLGLKYLLTAVLLWVSVPFGTQPPPPPVVERRASFLEAYRYVRQWEGNYSNHPRDRGGETYGGITRRYNPEWYGWRYIKRTMKRHQVADSAEFWVQDYYLNIWVSEGFYKLKNQEVANYLFDTRVHLGKRQTIRLLERMGVRPEGSEWAAGLDGIYVKLVRYLREDYYRRFLQRHPSQRVFKHGWEKRANG